MYVSLRGNGKWNQGKELQGENAIVKPFFLSDSSRDSDELK